MCNHRLTGNTVIKIQMAISWVQAMRFQELFHKGLRSCKIVVYYLKLHTVDISLIYYPAIAKGLICTIIYK